MKTAFRIILIIIINALLLLQINAQTPGLIIRPGNPAVFDPNGDGYISLDEFGFVSDDMSESELRFVSIATADMEPTEDPKGPSCHFNDIVDTGAEEPIMVRNDGTNFIVRFRQSTTVNNAKGYTLLIDADGLFGSGDIIDGGEGANYYPTNPGFEIEISLLTKFGVYLNNIDNIEKGNLIPGNGINDGFYTPSLKDASPVEPLNERFQLSMALTNNCGDADVFYEFYLPVADIEAAYPGFSTSLIRIVGLTSLNPLPTMGNANWSDLGGIDDSKYGGFEEMVQTLIDVAVPTDPDDLDGTNPSILRLSECPEINSVNTITNTISGISSEADGTEVNIYNNAAWLALVTVSGGTWTYDASGDGLIGGDIISATATSPNKQVSTGCSNDVTVIDCPAIPDPPAITASLPADKGLTGTYSLGGTTGTVLPGGPSDPEIQITRLGTGIVTNDTWNVTDWSATPVWTKNAGAGEIGGGIYSVATVGLSCNSLESPLFCYVDNQAPKFNSGTSSIPSIVSASNTDVSGTILASTTLNSTIYLYEETAVGSGVYQLVTTTTILANETTWSMSGLNIESCKSIKAYHVEENSVEKCPGESAVFELGGTAPSAPVITDNGDCAPAGGTIITIQGTSAEQEGTIIKLYKNGSGTAEAQIGIVNADGSWYVTDVSMVENDYVNATTTLDNGCAIESALSTLSYTILSATPNTASIDLSASDNTSFYTEDDTDVTIAFTSFTGTARLYIDQELIGLKTGLSAATTWTFALPYDNGDYLQGLYAGGELTVTLDDGTNCESDYSASEIVQCSAPASNLILSPDPSKVCYNAKGTFTVENTQALVVYTPVKVSDGSVIGYSTLSILDGSDIAVKTYNLTVDPTDITVNMMKISRFICESTNTNNITFNVNSELTAGTSSATDPTCATGSNGEIVASASGGSGTGYEYQLDGGAWQASPTFSDLSAGTYTVSIKDDELCADDQTDVILADGIGACSINISIDDVTLAEGNSGITSFNFTVTLDEAYGTDITLDYATTHTGINPTDASDHNVPSGSITIPAGLKTKAIPVNVNGDTNSEPDETFTVTISNASFGTIIDDQGIGTITDDDAVVNIAPVANDDSNSGNEDNAVTLNVTTNDTDSDGTI
ncbi:MAG: hypothetical protein QM504_05170, partial [Pseudomonadota bacterium]